MIRKGGSVSSEMGGSLYTETGGSTSSEMGGSIWSEIVSYNFSSLMPAPDRGTPAQRFGMFNDSYSRGGNNYTDGGSLSEGYSLIGGQYDRNAALTWIRNQNNFYGGETVRSGNEPDNFYRLYPRFPNVPHEAAYARTSHLNTSYSRDAYQLWGDFIYNKENVTTPFTPPHDGIARIAVFDPIYDGRSGMEYMRDRLGYRFVLRQAYVSEWVDRNGILRFEGKIQNVGFGNVINEKNVSILLISKDGTSVYAAKTKLDPRDWMANLNSRADNISAWNTINFAVKLSEFGNVPAGEYYLYLKINDPNEKSLHKRSIRFANAGNSWNPSFGANRIGTISVRS